MTVGIGMYGSRLMTIDELLQQIDPLSYWSFYNCRCKICAASSVGVHESNSGIQLIDLCETHIQAPFFRYRGQCEVLRHNMQICGAEAVGFFTTQARDRVRVCRLCANLILMQLATEQPQLWTNPEVRNQNQIIKMLKKWSRYDRIVQLAPPLC